IQNRIQGAKKLNDSIKHRVKLVCHETSNGVPVGVILNRTLKDTFMDVVICTQAGLTMIEPALLEGWTLIIDEVPKAIEYWNTTLSETEQHALWQHLEISESKLSIINGEKSALKDRLAAYKSSKIGSTLSKTEQEIYNAL